MGKRINALQEKNAALASDSNPETIASFSSLRDRNNDISRKSKTANEAFYKGYQSANGPTPEPDSRKNYRTYPYDYFSGIDAKVFFGDVWVDDIVTIQYSVSQNKTPIYGYASQLYDAIARGTVIVQGSLTISFKEMGYLNMVQRIIETQRAGAASAIEKKIDELREKGQNKKLEFIPNLEGSLNRDGNSLGLNKVAFSPNGTAQIIRKGETIEDILRNKKGGNIVSSGLGAVYFDEENPNGSRDFEDFAEVLEDTVWGDSNGHILGHELKYRRADEFDYYYANNKDAGGIRVPIKLSDGGADYSQVLNILITFGDMNDFRAEHTITVLNDVHFTSQNVVLAPTGEPIGETYTFIARDINQGISTSQFNIDPIIMKVGQDINVSKLSDVQEVEKYLDFQQGVGFLDIRTLASFDPALGWIEKKKQIISTSFTKNTYEELVDQLIRAVERGVNDPVYSELEPAYTQHIVAVKLTYENGETPPFEINFVIDQSIKNTLTYKVISPTRNNFTAVNIFNREDMWEAITAAELQKKKDEKTQALEQKQERDRLAAEAKAKEAEDKKKAQEAQAEADKAALAAQEANARLIQSMSPASPEEVEAETKKALQTAGLSEQDASVAAKAAAEQQKNAPKMDPLTVLNTKPAQTVYETQGPAGAYSHNDSESDRSKVQIDVSPITAGSKGNLGQVYIPVSNEAQLTFGKSSVEVNDPTNNQRFTVAHLQIEQQYVGQSMSLSQITGGQKLASGGVFVTPLSADPSSGKFSGAHAHFQQDIPKSQVNNIQSVQQSREAFRNYLIQSYQKENITYNEVNRVTKYPSK